MGRSSSFGRLLVKWRLVVRSILSGGLFASNLTPIGQDTDINWSRLDHRTAAGLMAIGSENDSSSQLLPPGLVQIKHDLDLNRSRLSHRLVGGIESIGQ